MVDRKRFINVRGGYSDTSGVAPCNTEMQLFEFDKRTRMMLSNRMFEILKNIFQNPRDMFTIREADNAFCEDVMSNVFVEPVRLLYGESYNWSAVFKAKFDPVFFNANYNEILDLLWYICKWIHDHMRNREINNVVYDAFNNVFEKEYVGYRFVDGQIVAITDEQEIDTIEEACRNPYEGCRSHLKKAVVILADRDNKDYKNCIKESICAVESICQVITKNDKATLGQALKLLKDNGLKIHSALESAFSKLYGYTSDEGGIRHCEGMFESDVSFEEAKFMLVSCSAFVNYLIAESGKNNA